ncbi:transcriptional regulator [Janthinobacterium sp. RA13]|uniref:transcriptional regulator n=1 Tax=Janthinobacterium sp. RA13 TaxID=1502762 RepID=UPI0009DD457B|nr:YdaS family helix-turn-helix protein [Janthinobacterium sp. RA13]
MKLLEYVKARGAQRDLAAKLSITPVLISQWASESRPVPPERCVEIEQVTGGIVRRQDLRPNDWHRIWPELVVEPAQRRATDPLPAPGHAGRQPPSPTNILDTVPAHSVVLPAIPPSLDPKEKP